MKKLFDWKYSWPWLLVNAIATVLYAVALIAILSPPFNTAAFTVFTVVYLSIVAITALRFLLLGIRVEKWNNSYLTEAGAAVVCEDGIDPYSINFKGIDRQITETLAYWDVWKLKDPRYAGKSLDGILEGGTITVTKEPTPCSSSNLTLAAGLVTGPKSFLATNKNPNNLIPLVKHETSHICLSALGIPSSEHHMIFSKEQYC